MCVWVLFFPPPTGSETEDITINIEDASDQISKSGNFFEVQCCIETELFRMSTNLNAERKQSGRKEVFSTAVKTATQLLELQDLKKNPKKLSFKSQDWR